MDVLNITVSAPGESRPDVLAVAIPQPAEELAGAAARLDEELGGRIRKLVETGEVKGRWNSAVLLHLDEDGPAPRVAVTGLGKRERVDADAVRTAAAAVAKLAKPFGGTIGWLLDDDLSVPLDEQARAVVEGIELASYDPGEWKSERPENRRIEGVDLVTAGDVRETAERSARVAAWANRARHFSNMPANELTPEALTREAQAIAGEVENLTVEVLGLEQTLELGMGAFNAVAQGSTRNPPQMIVMRYDPPSPARDDVTLGLVGKAITFDTGGISLKDPQGMEEMKHDMSGGGAVVAAMGAIADVGVPTRAIAVVAATENMPDGDSYRPGDILRARNGKTIEVISTDAEGRLVLADALTYAREQGATHIIDLATLTGAIVVALGDLYAGVFANDDEWRETIVAAGDASGDLIWPMPVHPRYRRMIDSTYADMRNTGTQRMAGAQAGAELLQEFAGDGPWAHLDVAGTAFMSQGRPDYLHQKGGTGYGVRLLVELAQRLA